MLRYGCLLVLLGGCVTTSTAPRADDKPEQAVCNVLLEPLAFWLWQRAAGPPRLDATVLPPHVEAIEHRTRDGRRLSGYRLRASTPEPKGFLLVAQGNATLAEQLLEHLRAYSDHGYEVYVYDYRGYARSEGKRRLKAIVSDYQEIFAVLSQARPGERLLYGMSFGGIVLLNVIGSGAVFDRAVVDSTPSFVSNYGCPQQYDPIANLPTDGARLLLIAGDRDRVVPATDSAELLAAGAARGARAVRSPDYAHPFMDKDPLVRRQRVQLIQSFLLGVRE